MISYRSICSLIDLLKVKMSSCGLFLSFGGFVVKCHLSRILGEKKLRISDVARDTGLSRGTITRLYHETAVRIDFEVLEVLCTYLQCELSELLTIEA
jgi:putative transcriptional regulator